MARKIQAATSYEAIFQSSGVRVKNDEVLKEQKLLFQFIRMEKIHQSAFVQNYFLLCCQHN